MWYAALLSYLQKEMLKARLLKATHPKLVIRQALLVPWSLPIIPDAILSNQEMLTRAANNTTSHISLSPQNLQLPSSKRAQFWKIVLY